MYDLINVAGPFAVILPPCYYCKGEFTYIFSSGRTARKITKILLSFGF